MITCNQLWFYHFEHCRVAPSRGHAQPNDAKCSKIASRLPQKTARPPGLRAKFAMSLPNYDIHTVCNQYVQLTWIYIDILLAGIYLFAFSMPLNDAAPFLQGFCMGHRCTAENIVLHCRMRLQHRVTEPKEQDIFDHAPYRGSWLVNRPVTRFQRATLVTYVECLEVPITPIA